MLKLHSVVNEAGAKKGLALPGAILGEIQLAWMVGCGDPFKGLVFSESIADHEFETTTLKSLSIESSWHCPMEEMSYRVSFCRACSSWSPCLDLARQFVRKAFNSYSLRIIRSFGANRYGRKPEYTHS